MQTGTVKLAYEGYQCITKTEVCVDKLISVYHVKPDVKQWTAEFT